MKTWVVVYASGMIHGPVNAQAWGMVPDDGVLFVLEYAEGEPRGRYIGYDYYLLRGDTMMGCFSDGLWQHLRDGIPKGAVKFGKWVENAQWRKVFRQHFPGETPPEGYNARRQLVARKA